MKTINRYSNKEIINDLYFKDIIITSCVRTEDYEIDVISHLDSIKQERINSLNKKV